MQRGRSEERAGHGGLTVAQILDIDARGRLTLPDEIREAAHIQAPGKVSIRVRPDGLLLCSRPADLPEDVAQFASLNGPVDAWGVLEGEIEAEHGGASAK
jgi:bifunctional DNA-binding transcriptional regulator/antitoxin component of YhaV-PrlF toxin-antitoxin module